MLFCPQTIRRTNPIAIVQAPMTRTSIHFLGNGDFFQPGLKKRAGKSLDEYCGVSEEEERGLTPGEGGSDKGVDD